METRSPQIAGRGRMNSTACTAQRCTVDNRRACLSVRLDPNIDDSGLPASLHEGMAQDCRNDGWFFANIHVTDVPRVTTDISRDPGRSAFGPSNDGDEPFEREGRYRGLDGRRRNASLCRHPAPKGLFGIESPLRLDSFSERARTCSVHAQIFASNADARTSRGGLTALDDRPVRCAEGARRPAATVPQPAPAYQVCWARRPRRAG